MKINNVKTIEEEAELWAKDQKEIRLLGQRVSTCRSTEDFQIDAFIAGAEFAQRWISVEDELPEQVEKLIGNRIKSENVLVKRRWDDTGEIAIEINCRFRPSPRIGFFWNIEYKGSSIIEWRPIERF